MILGYCVIASHIDQRQIDDTGKPFCLLEIAVRLFKDSIIGCAFRIYNFEGSFLNTFYPIRHSSTLEFPARLESRILKLI